MATDIDAASLMPPETPILKVSRPVAACSRCRGAKIKCDGKLPACTSCEKSGRAAECSSTNDQFARGKERSYVSTLETRIDKLQARLEEARARKPSVVEPEDDMPSTRRQSHQVPDLSISTGNKVTRRKETTAIDDLVSNFGFLSVNATARDFDGFTSTMSYARLIMWACSKDPLPNEPIRPLPPRHAVTGLMQHYLSNIYLLLPLFDEAMFYAAVDSLYSRNPDHADPNEQFLVRTVLAISCASMSEQRGDNHYREAIRHICAAVKHSEDVFHPGTLSSIQGLVLLTEYAMLDPHHFDSWSLIGAASRAMVDLGLHQDPPKGTPMLKAKLDLRRRIYYCIYVLDRSTSMVQSRAFSFSDDSAKVKVPYQQRTSSAPTTPQSMPNQNLWSPSYDHALDLINLRKLQSTWYSDLFQSGHAEYDRPYSYIWKTCDGMRKWFDTLPSSTSPNVHAFFELDLLYSYVYVLSPSPRVPVVCTYAERLVFEYCILYADIVFKLMNDPSYASPLTFYDAMRVYMTGRQFHDLLQRNTDELLHGHIPQLPVVKKGTPAPPSIPVVALPPGDTVLRFNTERSIHCIAKLTECLSRFGVRWGYNSWAQRYQSETSGILDELDTRLRSMEGVRRPSMWHHQDSLGSMSSNHSGSMPYDPSQSSMSSAHAVYQQGDQSGPPMQVYLQQSASIQQTPGPAHAVMAHQTSPPQYALQPTEQQHFPSQYAAAPQVLHQYPRQPMDMAPQYGGGHQAQQPYPHYQQPGFNFNEAVPPPQVQPFAAPGGDILAPSHDRRNHPNQQFMNWSGYAGQGGAPDTLDDENAVPPHSNPWNIDTK